MAGHRHYEYPLEVGKQCEAAAPTRGHARLVQAAAHKFAYRKNWVFRTRWDGATVRIRRAA